MASGNSSQAFHSEGGFESQALPDDLVEPAILDHADGATSFVTVWLAAPHLNPPEVPPCPRGDGVFIERGITTFLL
jgi:hypothetical protein